jgi:release factor glutamine methyltransferase
VLGWTTERFFVDEGTAAPPDFDTRYNAVVARRAAREPFAYIVGRQEFWELSFEVSPAVLIPRPETELIVESAIAALEGLSAPRVADIGTGSGCLAIALARERAVTVVATDLSEEALAVARRNADRLGAGARIAFCRTDLLDGVDERFDLIVSNPPYVCERDRAGIQPEVRYEPAQALFAGDDGLDVIRRLIPAATARLKPGGRLMFEFGFGQADAVSRLIADFSGLQLMTVRRDLQDIPRVVIARRRA